MKTTPGYIAALLLPVPGLAVFFLNPNRSTSLAGGFILNLILAALVFYFTIPQEIAIDKFKRYAREGTKENRNWLIAGLGVYLACGVLILVGINSGFLRFLLFLIMWGGAIAAGEFTGFFVWQSSNKEWVAKELAKDAAEAELQAKEQQEAQKLAAQRAAQRKQAEAAAREKAAQEAAEREKAREEAKLHAASQTDQSPSSKTRPRIQAVPDPKILLMLKSGNAAGLQMALSNRSPEALAALEETIALYSGNSNPEFYRVGGMRIHTEKSVQDAKEEIMELALAGNLLQSPAYSQSLIASLGVNPGISELIMRQLASVDTQALYDYQLLGVQMQLAHLVNQT